jgi:hypothetical protein
VVFAWILFESREHRDQVNANVMADPRMASMGEKGEMPFDFKRMAYGGFRTSSKPSAYKGAASTGNLFEKKTTTATKIVQPT